MRPLILSFASSVVPEKMRFLSVPPTFGMYAISAKLQNAKLIEVPLKRDSGYTLDAEKIIKTWREEIKVIFLCSPNNPTGNLISQEQILQLCSLFAGKSLIVVDEAYIEFADSPSLAARLNEYENLIVLRTLSKAFGLAGARCGALLGLPMIIEQLRKVIAPYPLPSPSVDAALIATQPDALSILKEKVAMIKKERDWLYRNLKRASFVKTILPSQANFLLISVSDSKRIIALCKEAGIVLRDMSRHLGLKNSIRITIGTKEENRQLIQLLNEAKI